MKIHLAQIGVRINVEFEKSYFFVLNRLLRWYQPDEREGGGGGKHLEIISYDVPPVSSNPDFIADGNWPLVTFLFFSWKKQDKVHKLLLLISTSKRGQTN